MDVLFVHFRLPFYSVAKKSFQVRASLLLPSPSALKGALAKGLALLSGSNYSKLDEMAKKLLEEINKKLVDVTAVSASSPAPLVRNYFLLRRLRTLEKDSKKDEGSEKTDAMRREYVFAHEIYAIYIFKTLSEDERTLYRKAAFLIDTLGDTESLVSVIYADFVKLEMVPQKLYFYAPLDQVSRKISENIDVLKNIVCENMRVDPDYGFKEREDIFYLPILEKKVGKHIYYEIEPKVETKYSIRVRDRELGIWIPEEKGI